MLFPALRLDHDASAVPPPAVAIGPVVAVREHARRLADQFQPRVGKSRGR